MSMPQIPEEKNRPNICEVTVDILKSVALEETALAHILNAEAERTQAVAKKYECLCDEISLEELSQSVRQTEKMLSTVIMKEWLLLKKMETALEINQKMTGKKPNCTCEPKNECRHCQKFDCCKPCCRR